MSCCRRPDNEAIAALFEDQATLMGGRLVQRSDRGPQIYLRSVLPHSTEVLPGDVLERGAALRADEKQIELYTYIYRQVCSNGMILPLEFDSFKTERIGADAPPVEEMEVLENLRVALSSSSERLALEQITQRLRVATAMPAAALRAALDIHFSDLGLAQHLADRALRMIDRQLTRERDRTAFALINSVTATAQRQEDPQVRWRLEQLGGVLAARLVERPLREAVAAKLAPVPS